MKRKTANLVKERADYPIIRLMAFILAITMMISFTGCLKSSSEVRGNVTGKVYDSNGMALNEARVEVYGTTHSVLTNALGQYTITGIEPGSKRLVATYKEESVVLVVEIKRGETLEGADLTFDVIDGLPPVITEVGVENLSEDSAEIVWTTNELADSTVDYATGPIGLGDYTMLASSSALTLDHRISITNLLPGRTYHFRVRSRDFERNEGVSSDYQFITPAGEAPGIPANFALAAPTEMERIAMSWTTGTSPNLAGYNLYRSEAAAGPFTKVNGSPIPPDDSGITNYRDDGLKIAVKYYYQLKAIDIAGNESVPAPTLSLVTVGTLAENRTLRASESPYIIQGDIRVRGGAVLTIEPGVELRFTLNDSLPDSNGIDMAELIVQGGLSAVGTADKRIIFTSAENFPSKASWGGLAFISTTQPENNLRYVTIMFADQGIRSEGSAPSIENTEVGLCGIGFNIGLSTALNIRHNTIRDCDVGMVTSNSNIRNNLFIDNQVGAAILGNDLFEHNTVDCLVGVQIEVGNPIIRNNIIAYTGSSKALYGIHQTQQLATPSMTFNNVHNYTIAYEGTNGTGTANIDVDPLFIGGIPYSYQLQTVAAGYASDSPCLTAGENSVQQGRYGP